MNVLSERSHRSHRNAELQINYPPALYHKMLDYRVTEILLATLMLGTILFFRSHH